MPTPIERTVTSSRAWLDGGAGGRATLDVGARVGRYVVRHMLGEGGMGTVYLAHDPELDRDVALKRLHGNVLAGDDAQSRLLREARSMARLSHPNVVTVYDLLIHDGHLVLAMELVSGETLRAWLARERRSWQAVVATFLEAGRGLAAAHDVGLVHRDFKADNVLVSEDGRVRVTDFGLARAVAEPTAEAVTASGPRAARAATITRSGALMGTPAYMAPEQHHGRADARSDQFAFAASLHEALAGELPFTGETWDELRRAVERGPRSLLARDAPSWVQKIVRRALSVDADARFASMAELLAALSRDPAVVRRRWIASSVVVVGVVAACATGYTQARLRAHAACASGRARLAGVWDEAAKKEVEAAFCATRRSFGADALQSVERSLDAYAAAWSAMHTDACEATHVRGEQSAALLDLRMACLGERREQLKSVVDAFRHADGAMVQKAAVTAQSLRTLAPCADARGLRALAEPPASAKDEVRALKADIGRARGLLDVGSLPDALKVAQHVADEGARIGFAPLEAEALIEVGLIQRSNGDMDASERSLYRAAFLADGAADDLDRAWAWTSLLYGSVYMSKKKDGADILRQQAAAAAKRVPDDVELQATYEGVQGSLLLDEEKRPDARAAFERQLQAHERAHGKDCVHAYVPLANIGLSYALEHDTGRALEAYDRALRVAERSLGPASPEAALLVGHVGAALDDSGEYARAEEHHQRAAAIVEAALGPDNAGLAIHLGNLARARSNQGKFAEAADVAERALAIREKALGPTHMKLIYPLVALGEAYVGLGQDERAAALLERALALKITATVGTARAEAKFLLARALGAGGRAPLRAVTLAREAKVELAKSSGARDQRLLGRVEEWLDARATAMR